MIKNLEQNYISVVLVINDDNSQVEKKINEIKKFWIIILRVVK